jgi:hypothetical protein
VRPARQPAGSEIDPAEAAAWEALDALSGTVGHGDEPCGPEHDALVAETSRRIQAQHEALSAVFPPRD